MKPFFAAATAAATVAFTRPASADQALTLEAALTRARERAPAIIAAAAALDEARARALGAAVLLHDNPEVEGSAGARFADHATLLEGSFGIRQVFELGGQRQARIDAAGAAV